MICRGHDPTNHQNSGIYAHSLSSYFKSKNSGCEGAWAPSHPEILVLADVVQQVCNCQHRMVDQHARPGEAHHLAHLLAHGGFVTVHRAFCTGGFVGLKGTALDTLQGVIGQLLAGRAEGQTGPFGRVFFPAVKLDHQPDGLPFALQPVCPGKNHLEILPFF